MLSGDDRRRARAERGTRRFEVCGAHRLEVEQFRELFPEGYRRGACRIAGLPFFA